MRTSYRVHCKKSIYPRYFVPPVIDIRRVFYILMEPVPYNLRLYLYINKTKSIWKMLSPFATTIRLTPIHQVSPLYCRTPPAHRCPQRRQRQRVTEGTAMAPWNGPNNEAWGPTLECGPGLRYFVDLRIQTYTEPAPLKYRKLAEYLSQAAQSRQPCVNSNRLSQWEALGTSHFWSPTKSTYLNWSLKIVTGD